MNRTPKLGIYVGQGASHSWTWCVDLLERIGLTDLSLVGSKEEFAQLRGKLDVLLVSGGDTAAIAAGLKSWGASAIQEFVEDGGIYVGICAGACLLLRSSKIDLSDFNLTSCMIANIADEPPEAINLAYKCCTPYRGRFVFQPIYGPIWIKLAGHNQSEEYRSLRVPLYGGPAIVASSDVEELAVFERLDREAILVVNETLATRSLLGQSAAVRKKIGKGCAYLLSPHFEHPRHPEANAVLIGWLAEHWPALEDLAHRPMQQRIPDRLMGQVASSVEFRRLRSAVSEGRIVAKGISLHPVTWLIGKKVWEPEKLEMFLLAVWKRLPQFAMALERGSKAELVVLGDAAEASLNELRVLKEQVSNGGESIRQAEKCFAHLQWLARSFLELYFRLIAKGCRVPAG